MMCAEMYEQMLEADLSELRLDGASPLAEHLRDCARCRSIATRLTRDTQLLATVVARRSPRRTSLARRYAVLAVAASLFVVLARWPDARDVGPVSLRGAVVVADTSRLNTEPPSSTHVLPVVTSPGGLVSARQLSARPATVRTASVVENPVRAQRISAALVEQPRSIAAIRLPDAPRAPLGAAVSVDPADGKRATIIRTTNPAITVVWLQD